MSHYSGRCFPAVFPSALSPGHKATRALVVWCSDAGCSTRRTQAEVHLSASLVHCVLPAQCHWGSCYTPSVGWVPTGPTNLHYRKPTHDRSVLISYHTTVCQNWKYYYLCQYILFIVNRYMLCSEKHWVCTSSLLKIHAEQS